MLKIIALFIATHNYITILLVTLFINFLATFYYKKGNKQVSFFCFYLGIHILYFYLASLDKLTLMLTYYFYLLIFSVYHYYFTFTKRFFLRTLLIIKGYFKTSNYFKLLFWILLVFIPTLFSNIFILIFVFNPVLILASFCGNFLLLSLLLTLWFWLVFLVVSNKYNLCTKFLKKLLIYFSRRACLHYIGNFGSDSARKLGLGVFSALGAAIPACTGIFLDIDSKAGAAAYDSMNKYRENQPDCDIDRLYAIYETAYNDYYKHSIVGRFLIQTNWQPKPGCIELVLSDHPDVQKLNQELAEISKKNENLLTKDINSLTPFEKSIREAYERGEFEFVTDPEEIKKTEEYLKKLGINEPPSDK